MKNIITIQHTQSEQHVNKMIGSLGAWNLTEVGIKQAENIGKNLSNQLDISSVVLYSSDILRAVQTAEIISKHLNTKPIYTELLREFDMGEANGKSKEWAKNNLKCDVWDGTVDWPKNIYDTPFLYAESKMDVWKRVTDLVNMIKKSDKENIVIVSHDGTLSILFAIWLNFSIEMLERNYISGKPGGVSFLHEDKDGNHIMTKLNDLSYTVDLCELK